VSLDIYKGVCPSTSLDIHDGSSDEIHTLPGSNPAVVLKAKLVYTLRLLIRGTDVCYFASFQPD